MDKPKLTPEELVIKMRDKKGITFCHMSEQDAVTFLREKNNYFRLAAYRKNYDKRMAGEDQGKYIGLDFACLVDLSIIDMHLRNLIFQMCLDIEHDLKVRLLRDITNNPDEDGYRIVREFITRNNLYDEIYQKRYSTYVGDLIRKFFYFDTHEGTAGRVVFDNVDINCPIWAFVEIISFGTFTKLYDYYYGNDAPIQASLLNPVKSLRNACAHNNCIIYNLRRGNTRPPRIVSQFVSNVKGIGKYERERQLSAQPVFEYCCLLMIYDITVSSNVKSSRYKQIYELVNNRMLEHKEYYEKQQVLTSAYKFIKEIVDYLIN